VPTISERLRELYGRLSQAPPAACAEEAYRQIVAELEVVEDAWNDERRMSAPPSEHHHGVLGRDDLIQFHTKGHVLTVRENGAYEIRDLAGALEFSKPGADGRPVDP
jgi:hypothetical protein